MLPFPSLLGGAAPFVPTTTYYTDTTQAVPVPRPAGATKLVVETYGPGEAGTSSTNSARPPVTTNIGGHGGNYAKRTLTGSALTAISSISVQPAAAVAYGQTGYRSAVKDQSGTVLAAASNSNQTGIDVGDQIYYGAQGYTDSNSGDGGGVAGPQGSNASRTGFCTYPGRPGSGGNYGPGGLYGGGGSGTYAGAQGLVVVTWS